VIKELTLDISKDMISLEPNIVEPPTEDINPETSMVISIIDDHSSESSEKDNNDNYILLPSNPSDPWASQLRLRLDEGPSASHRSDRRPVSGSIHHLVGDWHDGAWRGVRSAHGLSREPAGAARGAARPHGLLRGVGPFEVVS
jgi:hypothetical protein